MASCAIALLPADNIHDVPDDATANDNQVQLSESFGSAFFQHLHLLRQEIGANEDLRIQFNSALSAVQHHQMVPILYVPQAGVDSVVIMIHSDGHISQTREGDLLDMRLRWLCRRCPGHPDVVSGAWHGRVVCECPPVLSQCPALRMQGRRP